MSIMPMDQGMINLIPGMPAIIPQQTQQNGSINPQLLQMLQPQGSNPLLNLGLGLLRGGGPSTTPTNFLGILGGAGQHALQKKQAMDQQNVQKLLALENLKRQQRGEQFRQSESELRVKEAEKDRQLRKDLLRQQMAAQKKLQAGKQLKFKIGNMTLPNNKKVFAVTTPGSPNVYYADPNGKIVIGGRRFSIAPPGSRFTPGDTDPIKAMMRFILEGGKNNQPGGIIPK